MTVAKKVCEGRSRQLSLPFAYLREIEPASIIGVRISSLEHFEANTLISWLSKGDS
ncbi:MAG TPA: hypothetical protein VJQ56_07820 [Blastocatellia bacterium]|nr:hypothetical protein [Blastocatellia bacterium]